MSELDRRRIAVEATMARFAGIPHAYGSCDCVKVGVFHLRQMGFHENLGLHKAGTYRTLLGAKRALRRAGHSSIAAAIDGLGVPRVAPAAAWLGDFLLSPGTDGLEALMIVAGAGTMLAFHEDVECLSVIDIARWDGLIAWRL